MIFKETFFNSYKSSGNRIKKKIMKILDYSFINNNNLNKGRKKF